jgi:hypothetical protein
MVPTSPAIENQMVTTMLLEFNIKETQRTLDAFNNKKDVRNGCISGDNQAIVKLETRLANQKKQLQESKEAEQKLIKQNGFTPQQVTAFRERCKLKAIKAIQDLQKERRGRGKKDFYSSIVAEHEKKRKDEKEENTKEENTEESNKGQGGRVYVPSVVIDPGYLHRMKGRGPYGR